MTTDETKMFPVHHTEITVCYLLFQKYKTKGVYHLSELACQIDSILQCLFSYRSQMMSKCGKNKKVAHQLQANVSMMSTQEGGGGGGCTKA